ncbi:RE1 [Symbiodinium microadriaticum]|nr:RE1 [Symbiodinium sp. KB8]CAE7873217.1 RE1 [Symbiodinium microadriaticum]
MSAQDATTVVNGVAATGQSEVLNSAANIAAGEGQSCPEVEPRDGAGEIRGNGDHRARSSEEGGGDDPRPSAQTAQEGDTGGAMRSQPGAEAIGFFALEPQTAAQIGSQWPATTVEFAEQRRDAEAVDGGGVVASEGSRRQLADERPGVNLAEAIQAEVQRQMSAVIGRLREVEDENVRLQCELEQERVRKSFEVTIRSDEKYLISVWTHGVGCATSATPATGEATVIEALAQSMKQLQDIQLKSLQKDNGGEDIPEAVKTSVATLPVLGPLDGDQSGLLFQDWLVQITTAMQDLSASSGVWWEGVRTIVVQSYSQWLGATPLERLGIEPTGSQELVAGKYLRSWPRWLQRCQDMGMSVPDGTVLARGCGRGTYFTYVTCTQCDFVERSNYVMVNLAGGETVELKMNPAGTLLVPPTALVTGWNGRALGVDFMGKMERLWESSQWVVHLYAGKRPNDEILFLERQGFVVLELDIQRGKSHDVNNPLVWRALEWAARHGRIASIIGGPPQNSFMLRRCMSPGPEALRSEDFPYGGWDGQAAAELEYVNKHTGYFAKMIFLHALATAGRCKFSPGPGDVREVGFLLEQPRDPRGRVQLDPLPPEAAPPSVWTREFSENVAIAVRAQRLSPRMLKMSTDQWREHVRRGHLPYRSDCLTCVMAGATGRRHARVEHPSCFTMSADVSGPLKVPGLDADARGAFPRPHKYLFVAKVRIPKTFVDDGRGTFVEYDPGELEGEGDDEARAPIGEDAVPEEGEEEAGASSKKDPNRYEDDLDMTGPDLVNLVFATAIQDNRSSTVLEAIQDVILYCSALSIPVLRFHCDRGMEFYAKATRQWLKYHGIRFTTSEGGLHQQNGVVENAVKYVKQRARTLLHGAKLPQRLWPQAVAAAAAAQRATALGYETKLAAPFGAKVLVRKREYGGSAEPGKPDDLAPRWVEGCYLGLSDTVRRGHLIYVVDKDTEKFIHTVHVRTDFTEPEMVDVLEADLPEPPSRRMRSKAAGSGDVVAVSKLQTVVSDDDLRAQAEALKSSWSQEEAENLCVQIALMLGPNEKVFGAFRHGGAVGLTKATYDRTWVADFLVKTFVTKCPDAEFTSLYVSVNSQKGSDREVLSRLGFPIPPEDEDMFPEVALRALSVGAVEPNNFEKEVEEEPGRDQEIGDCGGGSRSSSSDEEKINGDFVMLAPEEEVEHWDMFLPLEQGDPNLVPKARIASSSETVNMCKVEVTYTHNIENLLSSLSSPLAIVHTVEPKEVQDNFNSWLPAVKKKMSSFDHAVTKRSARDPQVAEDIRTGRAKVVPMKIVYTVKPPSEGSSEWFRRKARIVACGNMMAASGEDNYAAAAPAEVVRSSLAISSRRGWNAGVIDITSAFLQTPLSKVDCRFRVFGQPPRAFIREGLCEEHELWKFTHAVYGLRKSPKWWGEFRDTTLANLVVELEGRKVTLVRCRVESSWWKLVEESAVIGVIVIYVDDILICSTNAVIAAVARSIKELWSTSPLVMASEGAIKFLGLEIEKIEGGFAVSQADYIAELLRIHNVKGTQRDLIPVSRENSSFVATEEEAVFSEAELREAQQYAEELWLSQRSRPDLSYAASLISSLTTKAPRRASSITRKCLGFLQRTADHRLHLVSRRQELVSWTDASFAPEGARSHTGWLITAGEAPLSWRSSRQGSVTLSTAEAELVASVGGALALCSLWALWKEVEEEELKLIPKTDSTSSMAIQHGSSSWRTRHLRIKAAWIAEKVERNEITIEHCAGEVQLADALTKPLASAKLQQLSMMMGLLCKETYVQEESNSGYLKKDKGLSKILVALILLSQAITPAQAMDVGGMVTSHQPLSVDHGMVMWFVFGLVALLWTLAWEMLKYAGWQLYFTASPGAESRKLRRLQRIRDHTAVAIQHALEARRRDREVPAEVRRACDLDRRPGVPLGERERDQSHHQGQPHLPVGWVEWYTIQIRETAQYRPQVLPSPQ